VTSGTGSAPTITYTSSGTQLYQWSTSPSNPSTQTVTAKDVAGNSTNDSVTFVSDTTAPAGGALSASGTVNASGSVSYSGSGTFTITRTDYSESQSASQSGLASSSLTRQTGTWNASTTTCGSLGSLVNEPAGNVNESALAAGCYVYTLTGTDNVGNTASTSFTVEVDKTVPSANALSISSPSNAFFATPGSVNTLFYKGNTSGSFNLVDAVTDGPSGPASAAFPAIATTGWTHALETVSSGTGSVPTISYTSSQYSWTASPSNPTDQTITGKDLAGNSSTATLHFVSDTTAPAGGALTVNGTAASSGGSSSSTTNPAFTIGTRTDYTETQSAAASGLASSILTVQSETLSDSGCGSAGSGGPFPSATTISGITQPAGIVAGYCYLYTLTGTDNVGNTAAISTTVQVPLATDIKNNLSSPCTTLSSTVHSCTLSSVPTANNRQELILVFLNNGSSGTRTVSSISGTAVNSGASQLASNNFDTSANSWLYAWQATGTGTSGTEVVNFDSGAATGQVYIDVLQLAPGDAPIGTAGTQTATGKSATVVVPSIITPTDGEIAMIGVSTARTFKNSPPNNTFSTLSTSNGTTPGFLYGSFWTRPVQGSASFDLSASGQSPNWGTIGIEIDPPVDGGSSTTTDTTTTDTTTADTTSTDTTSTDTTPTDTTTTDTTTTDPTTTAICTPDTASTGTTTTDTTTTDTTTDPAPTDTTTTATTPTGTTCTGSASPGQMSQGLSTGREVLFFAVLAGSVLGIVAALTMPIPRRRRARRRRAS
jgi:hypothetical protein